MEPWNYQTDNNSEYNHWINLVSSNYTATGMVRVHLPTNAGATWNQVCFAVSQTGTCFITPDGTDGNGWSYKDFIIPVGHRLDSVFFSATRTGYPVSQEDFIFDYCPGTTTFNQGTAVEPWNYQTDNNSEYNHWINLVSFNYTATGMVRVHLPTNAGATWSQVCFATSQLGTGIGEHSTANEWLVYPNPASDYILVQSPANENKPVMATLTSPMSQTLDVEVKSLYGAQNVVKIEASSLPAGIYFLQVGNTVQKIQVIH